MALTEALDARHLLFDLPREGLNTMIDSQLLTVATAVVGAVAVAVARLRPGISAKIIASIGYSLLLVAAVTIVAKVMKL